MYIHKIMIEALKHHGLMTKTHILGVKIQYLEDCNRAPKFVQVGGHFSEEAAEFIFKIDHMYPAMAAHPYALLRLL
jgi:hypothetical protein